MISFLVSSEKSPVDANSTDQLSYNELKSSGFGVVGSGLAGGSGILNSSVSCGCAGSSTFGCSGTDSNCCLSSAFSCLA
jgi:hypothetical protein